MKLEVFSSPRLLLQWYAVGVVEDLDPRIPVAQQVLGERLVLWRDGHGSWRALRDECPHKCGEPASLSSGPPVVEAAPI